LVAADSEAPRDGKFLEILGAYDPMKDPASITLHKDKISHWLEKGATVTGSARAILEKEGLL
jgi:small subunit ribosomal protein S16